MHPVTQCLLLLVCAAVCSSRAIDGHCRCVKTNSFVNPKEIFTARSYEPRSYCNKKEVIVTLKDQTQVCLDPSGKFTQAILNTLQKQKTLLTARMKRTNISTAASATTS